MPTLVLRTAISKPHFLHELPNECSGRIYLTLQAIKIFGTHQECQVVCMPPSAPFPAAVGAELHRTLCSIVLGSVTSPPAPSYNIYPINNLLTLKYACTIFVR
ncbi:hypothetical protein HHI36_011334 [Cryptolaemus montrouzieri]|uniref:Uncharacterized protein n=1 Tax=Cryptolaemus montrouzieri TaxID=559131 RepID=A0ABD2MLD6_9CUCU